MSADSARLLTIDSLVPGFPVLVANVDALIHQKAALLPILSGMRLIIVDCGST